MAVDEFQGKPSVEHICIKKYKSCWTPATYSPPFAFFISNVLLDESFLVGVWVHVDRKDVGDEIHPLVVGSCRFNLNV